jgi:hypothetical protein
MSSKPTNPVKDSVPKINNEIAVGADLEFQRRWWRFERAVWVLFTVLVLLDVLGVFGRGWAAKGHIRAKDGAIDVRYERIERFNTPSILNVEFGPNAIHDGKVQLWLNYGTVKGLSTQRVVPQPLSSVIGDDGVLYTFDASIMPASVQFALQPSAPGIFRLELHVPGSQMLTTKVVVMP